MIVYVLFLNLELDCYSFAITKTPFVSPIIKSQKTKQKLQSTGNFQHVLHLQNIYKNQFTVAKIMNNVSISKMILVLDMTLNCILVYDSVTERFFRTLGPWTKLYERFFSFNKQYFSYLPKKVLHYLLLLNEGFYL